jgi:hypothetical protein
VDRQQVLKAIRVDQQQVVTKSVEVHLHLYELLLFQVGVPS